MTPACQPEMRTSGQMRTGYLITHVRARACREVTLEHVRICPLSAREPA
jgi:hypothetical protein